MSIESPKTETVDEIDSEALERECNVLYLELIKKLAIKEALTLLDKLPTDLVYHIKAHTEDVIRETILFALADGASKSVIEQQAISAAWHDVGFVPLDENEEYTGSKEEIAIRRFTKSVAYTQLSQVVRNEIIANIDDTTVRFINDVPTLDMEKSTLGYILDADVSNFGRDDFFVRLEEIRREDGVNFDNKEELKKFYSRVIALLTNHKWRTKSASALRDAKKIENLKKLQSMYDDLEKMME